MSEAARTVLERARAAWPDVELDPETFLAHREQAAGKEEHDPDLYLACACAYGNPTAIKAFDDHYLGAVIRYIHRIDPAPEFAEEVRQLLRVRLLVADPEQRARIAAYSAQGPLGGWVRIAAIRQAVDLKRERVAASLHSEDLQLSVASMPEAERALLFERYGDQYSQALRVALGRLTVRERTLLRLSIVNGLTVEDLGRMYRVHKTTTARWIRTAREKLTVAIDTELKERLRLGESELRSLTGVLLSRLDVCLSELFDH
jgi:RNA polymerase sigma-70 factor (ECF subfamily)